jgi:Protein of unknown function (DUF2510)
MTSDQAPPAGWYPDQGVGAPAGQQRYWDGFAWTEHIAAPTTAPTTAPTVPTVAPRNGLGIAAIILGIIGAIFGIIPVDVLLGGILGVIGVIVGFLGRGRAMRGEAINRGIAERGILISTSAVAISVFSLFVG